nr:thioredoxin domain-containing protein [Sphingomonas arenae]
MLIVAAAALAAGSSAPAPSLVRVGPAKAADSLVEYGSLHCPHCAHFAEQGLPEIAKRVRVGSLRFEFRPFLIFPQDIPATLIARCVPAPRRLAFIEDYYRNSAAVTERVRASASQLNAVKEQGVPALNRRVAAVGGMKPIAARHGLTGAAVDQCVSDPKNMAWLESAQTSAQAAGVTGTPTFEVNGERMRLATADDLRAALDR